jgi:hypothetical protein
MWIFLDVCIILISFVLSLQLSRCQTCCSVSLILWTQSDVCVNARGVCRQSFSWIDGTCEYTHEAQWVFRYPNSSGNAIKSLEWKCYICVRIAFWLGMNKVICEFLTSAEQPRWTYWQICVDKSDWQDLNLEDINTIAMRVKGIWPCYVSTVT